MSRFLSDRLSALKEYIPGEQPQDMKYIKLNTNESPYDPSPEVKKAITQKRAAKLQLYPEPDCTELSDALARYYNVDRNNILIGNGSDEILNFCFSAYFDNKSPVLFPDITDATGNIASADLTHIRLEPGYYLISYEVSVVFNSANYMQVTPSYNGAPHLETSIYFATRTDGSSACGSSFLILYAPSSTEFSLTYSGSAEGRDGQVTLTIFKLRRN